MPLKIGQSLQAQADFDKFDANKDKALSSSEFDKWQAAHKTAKPGKAGLSKRADPQQLIQDN